MREVIRMFVRDLDLIRFIEGNNGICISDVARRLKMPYSTAYVKVHRLEKAGLLDFEYVSGKKTIKLTETAIELIQALEMIEREKKELKH
ncbi:MarR family transcriptional regulator [Archaeoglobus veneficus]|uniref:ArsR family transcriptional regulator n=1 Tax=Archaeoglobus veneficus (strain DSM 11195 / SNP6) TaxID=693661 RepID=F2KMU2_ARCVS|nr:helix-turn-helix domain-containing protein [Archaeoglobus veneficus]AEA46116.1 hypothetical protein Arcve_0075 [Archaeoglobus veneficus SNP6]